MKLTQEQENLLKYVSSVEVRRMIRSRMKTLLKDIQKTFTLSNELGWKWRMERDRRKARKELYQIEQQLINWLSFIGGRCKSSISHNIF